MNVKLRVLSAGALFFIGGQVFFAQEKKDDIKTKDIDEVVVVGYGTQKKREVTGAITQIKGESLSNLPVPAFDQALAGKGAGLQITQNSGLVGQAARIRIRGINSISSSTYPLIVVDGLPIFTGDLGGYAANNALADINPNDIESYEVLKDGAASAIYGSRAANGVILITTKKGKAGKTTLSYNGSYGITQVANYLDLLETPDFIKINNEKRANRGLGAWANGSDFNTNWQKAVLRTGTVSSHDVNFSGGLGNGSYYASIGYNRTDGIILANGLEKYTARLNADQKINNWLKVGSNLAITQTNTDGLNTGANSLSGAMFNVIRQLPNTPVYDPNGFQGYNIQAVGANSLVGRWQNYEYIANNLPNIRYVLDNNKFTTKNTRILGSAYGDFTLASWLNYRAVFSVDRSMAEGLLYYNPFHGDGISAGGLIRNSLNTAQRYNWQNILTATKSFGEHNLAFTAVNEYQKQVTNGFYGGGNGLADPFFNDNTVTGTYSVPISGGGKSSNAIISYLGRINYDFGKRYFISASLRADDLSKFAPGKRRGIFPGVSAGWTVSNEPFFNKDGVINDLKLRGSWGKTGNSEIVGGDFPYLGVYGPRKYGDFNGLTFAQMGNPDLTWEILTKTNFGVDLAMFKNRVRFAAEYFDNKTDKLVDKILVPRSAGVPDGYYYGNIGKIQNKGFEFSLDYNVLKTQDWSINLSSNLTLIKNKILELNDGKDQISENNILRVGESIYALYGVKYYGVNMYNGNPIYYMQNGTFIQGNYATSSYRVYDPANPTDVSKAAGSPDRFVLGNIMPTYYGAVNLNINYKSFDFTTQARFSGGNKIMNITRREMLSQFFNNNSTEILGRWQSFSNPGDGWTPKLWSSSDPIVNGPTMANSRFVEDADFVKFDNFTLGYSMPKNFLDNFKLTKFRIYVTAQNALLFSKYKGVDPEMESLGVDYNVVPRQQTFIFGVNVGL